ncbi:MAG: hypothetical protein LUD72_07540 [Bacteroidales bacterium]|nr:hypothetical protein [Bacteroidales bacterium]
MKYYAKLKSNGDRETILSLFAGLDINPDQIILDDQTQQKQTDSVYSKLKDELAETKEPLVIDDIFSLGKNAREISKELEWLKNAGIELYVLTLPSTLEPTVNRTDLICELNARYARREIDSAREGQRNSGRNIGRPRIPYPKNWDEEYEKWAAHEISSPEFMKAVGLSQGTFYNFLRHYKEELLKKEEHDNDPGQDLQA